MAEIKLRKRIIYSGDVFFALMRKGWSCTDISNLLNSIKEVDAVEVVRCKDCNKRYNPNECPMCILVYGEQHDFMNENGYCDRGERKDNG